MRTPFEDVMFQVAKHHPGVKSLAPLQYIIGAQLFDINHFNCEEFVSLIDYIDNVDLPLVNLLFPLLEKNNKLFVSKQTIKGIAISNNMELLQYIHCRPHLNVELARNVSECYNFAWMYNNLDIMVFLDVNGYRDHIILEPTFHYSVHLSIELTNNHTQVARYVASQRKEIYPWQLSTAVMALCDDTIQFLASHYQQHGELASEMASYDIFILAARNGRLDFIRTFIEVMHIGCSSPNVLDDASLSGNLELVVYLHEAGMPATTKAMDGAANAGHLEIVRFLHQHRTEGCTNRALKFACRNGHLDVTRWLHHNRTEGGVKHALLHLQNIESKSVMLEMATFIIEGICWILYLATLDIADQHRQQLSTISYPKKNSNTTTS
ncbi:hypothetical protein SAMD00019534_037700 [Acytostelium subglobosum LB1]|uniref:hypothetical protein n=1 Tax=Acytostelium subglobosum LB1 TaxID=1410327 RepID=UPI000644B101|nr:hypothetical protein SAMD00019534_037700 [Acytostelium subglobosum LB1]GAM20595.1 hypothetical protein SAMD00019534_037700 [Acytostelium subglobosum LB1]|eukprot:XP_012760116.1 hypothetical protein SAMD00019534_037700 [Acytostelium subglobosum LB1]